MPTAAIRVPLVRRARLGRLDDRGLAELAATGDERAFEALYERHHRPLLGYCRHQLGSREEGEDALQQTFLRAHRALAAHGAPEDVRPWLFAIARNRCRSLLAARRDVAVPLDDVEPATEGLAPVVERRDDLRALLADLHRLPEAQREALLLAELADLSHAEIGAMIGVPVEKVKALVFQARSALIAERQARETSCERIREQLATARGGELRRGPLRRHLRHCYSCRAYRAAVIKQRADLGLLLPAIPTAGLKAAVLSGMSAGGGGGAATVAAVAGGGATAAGGGVAVKLAVVAALAGGGGGAVAVERAAGPDPAPATAGAPARGAGEGSAGSVGEDERSNVAAGGGRRGGEESASQRPGERADRAARRAGERAARRAGKRAKDRAGDRGARRGGKDAAAKRDAKRTQAQRALERAARDAARDSGARGRSATPRGATKPAGATNGASKPAAARQPAPVRDRTVKPVKPSPPKKLLPPAPLAEPAETPASGGKPPKLTP